MSEQSNKLVVADLLGSGLEYEEFALPSEGKCYGNEKYPVELPGGIVKVRPMSLEVEKIVFNKRIAKSGKLFNILCEKCVQFPEGFNPTWLTSGDELYLFYVIRGVSYGEKYEYNIKCPDCGKINSNECDITGLQANVSTATSILSDHGVDISKEPIEVYLPIISEKTGKDIIALIRLPRQKDTIDIAEASAGSNDISELTNDMIYRCVVDIKHEDKTLGSKREIREFLDRIPSGDISVIRSAFVDYMPTISTKVPFSCSKCHYEEEIDLPIAAEFFRPAKRKRDRR